MSTGRWILVLMACLGVCCPVGSARAAAAPAAAPTKGSGFFTLDTAGRPTRVDRQVLGVVFQELRLTELRSRSDAREYRLSLSLRNPGKKAAVPSLRVVLWSESKPEAAFDIRGQERHLSLSPRTVMRFLGDLQLGKEVRVTRFTLVPLPPEAIVMRADRPLPMTRVPTEQLVRPSGAPWVGGKPDKQAGKPGEKEERLDPEQLIRIGAEMERYRAEVARMYEQQVNIPEANAMGTLAGVGPYGPIYQVPGGSGLNGLYVQAPNGWSSVQGMPMMMNSMSVWQDPFQGRQ